MKTVIGFHALDAGGFLIFSDGSIKYLTFFEIQEMRERLFVSQEAA